MNRKVLLISFLFMALFILSPQISADRGMVMIDPPHVIFTESEQQAIIAWDGQEELLLLSTGVSSSEPAHVLEVLPVPNNVTEVKEGDMESFKDLTRIINSKLPRPAPGWGLEKLDSAGSSRGVEIQYHEQIGPHEIMIVKVNNADYFNYWVRDFAFTRNFTYSEISVEFRRTITDYVERGINYFIFDVISTNETTHTVSPILYRFKTDSLYYPMKITSVSNMSDYYSTLKLYLLTDQGIADKTEISLLGLNPTTGFDKTKRIELTKSELEEVSEYFSEHLPRGSYAMVVNYYGPFRLLNKDMMLPRDSFSKPTTIWPSPVNPPGASQPMYLPAFLALAALIIIIVLIRPR